MAHVRALPVLQLRAVLTVLSLSAMITLVSLLGLPAPHALLSAVEPSCFFMAQLADPQFGIKNGGSKAPATLDWSAERAMLDLAVQQLNRLAPRFVILSGDYQNAFPPQGTPLHGATRQGDLGALQAEDVRRSLDALRVRLLSVTPGNHDLGDAMDASTLKAYRARWGEAHSSFRLGAVHGKGGIMFMAFDSLVFNATPPAFRAKLVLRLRHFLEVELDRADATEAQGVVLLTHVCPFVGSSEEAHGWANWPAYYREAVLGATLNRTGVRPRLVVCGHFHANADVTSHAFGSPIEAVTTSAVGCSIAWNGKQSGFYEPAEASEIAAAPTGADAFADFVLRDHSQGEANPALIPQRVRCEPGTSGVRLFEFCPDKGYRHKWFTLEALARVKSLASSDVFGGHSFTPFS